MHPTTLDGRYFVVEGQPMIVVAPRLFRYASSSLDFPVAAVTVYPAAARRLIAKLPTPPVAPVTSTGPLAGFSPWRSNAIMQSMAVYHTP